MPIVSFGLSSNYSRDCSTKELMFYLQVPLFGLFGKRLMVAFIEAPFKILYKPVNTILVNAVKFP